MGSMFTSRFSRRESEDASALPEATLPAAAEAAPAASEKIEAKAAAEAGEPASTETSVVPPARLVEGEKKADKPDAAEAKNRTAELLGQAKRYQVPAAAAAALLLALGLGYGAGSARQARDTGTAKALQSLEKTSADLRQAHGQLATELKSVKVTVEAMKGERDKARGELLAKQTQISERMDKVGQENATRVGRIAEQLDRIEKAQRSAAEKTDRADKAEKGDKVAAAAPLPPAKPGVDPVHTGSISDGKTVEKLDPRKIPLEGYAVRDYDEGYALVETRAGRYIDVAVGTNLPGIGRVEAIERRGRQWVVITPKGFIGER